MIANSTFSGADRIGAAEPDERRRFRVPGAHPRSEGLTKIISSRMPAAAYFDHERARTQALPQARIPDHDEQRTAPITRSLLKVIGI